MKHTAGEWTSNKITTKQGLGMTGGYQFVIRADTYTPSLSSSVTVAFAKQEVDARLIAAAPRMLEALKAISNLDKQLITTNEFINRLQPLLKEANQVLASLEEK